MGDIDLSRKVWGVKARNHFVIFSIAHVLTNIFLFLVFIDLINLPSNAEKEARGLYMEFLLAIPFLLTFNCICTILLFCFNYKLFYAFFSILLSTLAGIHVACTILNLFTETSYPTFSSLGLGKNEENYLKKYYKFGIIGEAMTTITGSFVLGYLCHVLWKLAFPKISSPMLHVIRKRSSSMDVDEEDEEVVTPEKSGKSRKINNTEKSGKSGASGGEE